jgi:hypothetical protein
MEPDQIDMMSENEVRNLLRKTLIALQIIASYDKDSGVSGICPYGCDCPDIAQQALREECNAKIQ